uniref:Tubulin delta chain n=2 Tax=Chlamydomonas reinhardtii TaxID=3055 RepID=O22416_CHLRE|nr:tubulin Uni3 [Chlamydomonas reinhardtii]
MPCITLQLGQCGNQLGCSLFNTLATEFSSHDYGTDAVHEYFRPSADPNLYTARSVLIDMEPKVVAGARSAAAASGSWWRYPSSGYLVMQSGSGNNWAQGFHGYGPQVHEDALDLVRKEVEHADSLTGFLLLQSMAGGTGAGLGTYVAEALRDEYHSAFVANCCVWPYESGEVIVQPYNTLLTLSHLADVSDGLVLLENEALHRTAAKLYGIARPSFGDMNGIAARALAAALLPSQPRGPYAGGAYVAPASQQHHHHHQAHGHGAGPGRSSPGSSGGGVQLPALRRADSSGGRLGGESPGLGSLGSRGGGATPPHAAASSPSASGAGGSGGWGVCTAPLAELVTRLCGHPAYRLLTLRSVPQLPPANIDFTTFTWPALTKRLRQMLVTGSVLEEGLDWSITPQSPGAAAALGAGLAGPTVNRALASWLILRGQGAAEADVGEFADPALSAAWSPEPLSVSYSTGRFGRCAMSACLLSNDRHCVGPIQRMQEHAYGMLESRAFVHQYEKYGLSVAEFQDCFARIEDIAQRYARL